MDAITSWLQWTVGTDWLHLFPYQKAIVDLRIKAEQEAKDTDRAIDLMRYDNLYRRTLGAGAPLKSHD